MTRPDRAHGICALASPWCRGSPGALPASRVRRGATVLSGREGPVLILDFHNYVMLIDPDTLLVWHQRHVEPGPSAPVVLRIFPVADLRRLEGELEELCGSMRRSGAPFISFSSPLCEFPVPTSDAGRGLRLSFPEQLRHVDELLILCHSSAVEESPPVDRSNLALSSLIRAKAPTSSFLKTGSTPPGSTTGIRG